VTSSDSNSVPGIKFFVKLLYTLLVEFDKMQLRLRARLIVVIEIDKLSNCKVIQQEILDLFAFFVYNNDRDAR